MNNGVVLAANGPAATRIGVMLPCAAAYGFALVVVGVRLAAKVGIVLGRLLARA